jgi:hypothetical protein
MSKSLVKLVDIALIPAALLVLGKFIGLVFVIQVFQLPWTLESVPDSLFSVQTVLQSEDVIIASTYSDLIAFIFVSIGFSFILIQATHFHESHITPNTLMKLSSNNLMGLVKSSFDLYHSAALWLIFVWLASGLVWINVLLSRTEAWVGIICTISVIIFTSILLQDVYKEINFGRKDLGGKNALA